MQGYEVKFNIYAESQEEADTVSRLVKQLVNDNARAGVAITAARIIDAFRRWGDSPFVRNRIANFFR